MLRERRAYDCRLTPDRIAPEVELKRWFSWRWYWDDALVEELVDAGKLRRVAAHVTPGG